MKKNIVYLITGFIFSLGLGLGGMLNPENIKRFLEVTNTQNWNPQLLIVLMSAVATYAIIYWRQVKCGKSCSGTFSKLSQGKIDRKLILGSAIFGMGWGLSGLCPAPAVARIGIEPFQLSTWVFVLLMFVGFKLESLVGKK